VDDPVICGEGLEDTWTRSLPSKPSAVTAGWLATCAITGASFGVNSTFGTIAWPWPKPRASASKIVTPTIGAPSPSRGSASRLEH
jgi:hypothetical protein